MPSKKISALDASAALTGDEQFATANGSANYRVTASQIKTFAIGDSNEVRTKLSAHTTFYVRTAPVVCTIATGTPGVVTRTAHGLSANDPVAISVPTDQKTVTLTLANPCVLTAVSNDFSNGDAVNLHTTGALPTSLPTFVINSTSTIRNFCPRTYYVINKSGNTFQLSLTSGGAAISTAALSQSGTHIVRRARFIEKGTCTFNTTTERITCTGHGLVTGDQVAFATEGSLVTGLAALGGAGAGYSTYYVKTVHDANTIDVSSTPNGAVVGLSGSATGTAYLFKATPMFSLGVAIGPLIEGETYYAKTITDANNFTISATPGGTALDFTGTQVGRFWLSTGNDTNDGSAQTRTGSFMTVGAALDHVTGNIDQAGWVATIEVSDGTYYGSGGEIWSFARDITTFPGAIGDLNIDLKSAGVGPTGVLLSVPAEGADTFAILASFGGTFRLEDFEYYNPSFSFMNCFGYDQTLYLDGIVCNAPNVNDSHFIFQNGCNVYWGDCDILYGCGFAVSSNGLVYNFHSEVISQGTKRLFNDPYTISGIVYNEGPDFFFIDRLSTWTGTYTSEQGFSVGPGTTQGVANLPGTAMVFSGFGEFEYEGWLHLESSFVIADNIQTPATTVGALPSAATAGAGSRQFVTDATSSTFNAPAVGSGANKVPVFSDGTGWFIG